MQMQAFHPAQPQPQYQMDPGDERLFVQFYMGAIKNEEKTVTAGHPVYDAVPFVKIMVPGDKNTMIDTIADANHKRRFAKLWDQFQSNQSQEMSGLPLREWPSITRAQAEELMHMNIVTVEQLATVADVYGTKIMGFNDLKRKANAYLEQAKDAAFAQRLSDENQALKDRVSGLEGEIKRLNELYEAMQKGVAKGK